MSETESAVEDDRAMITTEEWEDIRAMILLSRQTGERRALHDRAKLVESMRMLESRGNNPTSRRELFLDPYEERRQPPLAVSADNAINVILKHRKLPFRLRRFDKTERVNVSEGKLRMERI